MNHTLFDVSSAKMRQMWQMWQVGNVVKAIRDSICMHSHCSCGTNRITATPHGVFGAELPFSKITFPMCKLSEGSDDRIPVKSRRYTAKPASTADSKIVECECGFIVFVMY